MKLACIVFLLAVSLGAAAQISISDNGAPPAPSAMLDVQTTTKGFLPPRMTTAQRNAIPSPAEGLMVFNSETGMIDFYLGGSWKSIGGATVPTFQCGMKITDARDNRMYNTVLIGTQCWMAQELNYGTRISHTIPQSNNAQPEKYCYDDLESNCDVYGGLYQWNEMMQYLTTPGSTGICPVGWHIPTDAEWCTMEVLLDPTVNCSVNGIIGTDIATRLKEAGTVHWTAPNTGATNSSGFTALPAGYLCPVTFPCAGTFDYLGTSVFYWTSSTETGDNAWVRWLDNEFPQSERYPGYKETAWSVRCVKD